MTILASTYGIDINVDFSNYAVYYNAEFTKSAIVKTHICDFKQVNKYGVFPNNGKSYQVFASYSDLCKNAS